MQITDEGRNITVEVKKDDHNRDLSRAIVFVAGKLNEGYKLGTFFEKPEENTYAIVLDGRDKFDA